MSPTKNRIIRTPPRKDARHTPTGWQQGQENQRLFVAKRAPAAPTDSWWAQPVESREEFDRRVAQRSREAGWVGRTSQADR